MKAECLIECCTRLVVPPEPGARPKGFDPAESASSAFTSSTSQHSRRKRLVSRFSRLIFNRQQSLIAPTSKLSMTHESRDTTFRAANVSSGATDSWRNWEFNRREKRSIDFSIPLSAISPRLFGYSELPRPSAVTGRASAPREHTQNTQYLHNKFLSLSGVASFFLTVAYVCKYA
jgi:hypothetical protein